MKHFGLLLAFLTTIVVGSLGQTSLPKYYCQGCCSGAGVYYLKLDLGNKFELYYLIKGKQRENSFFGLGTFNFENDLLTLSFENIPQDGVDSRRIDISDSVIIHFDAVDNIRGDSVPAVNVNLKTGTVFYLNATGTIRLRFGGPETISFSALGYRDISYSMTETGEFEMKLRFNPEGTTYLKEGDKKELKLIRVKKEEWFQELDDKRLKFTTKSCVR